MRKNLIILLLCAPLLYITVSEGLRLYNVSAWSSPKLEATDDEAPPKPEVIAKGKKTADAIVDQPDGVTAAVLRIQSPPPGSPQDPPLGSVVVAYAKKRAERAFDVEKAKEDGAIVEKKITEILKKMRGRDGRTTKGSSDLGPLLDDYAEKVHDPLLLASARAEAAWAALEDCPRSDLEREYDAIDRWSPAISNQKTLSRTTFDSQAIKYREFLKDHESAKASDHAAKLVQQAAERLELAQRGAVLVEILNHSVETATDDGLAKRAIDTIAAIVKLDDDNQPKRVRSSVRRVLHALCDDLLKPEAYDESVFLRSQNSPARQRVNRKDVQITLKTGGDPVPLGPPGIDEYNLKSDQIENFTLKSTGELLNPPDAGVPPLEGTEYSDVIKAFNTERARVKEWSDLELGKLLDICANNQSKLDQGGGANQGGRTLVDRIKQLREIVRGHPSLFGPDVP